MKRVTKTAAARKGRSAAHFGGKGASPRQVGAANLAVNLVPAEQADSSTSVRAALSRQSQSAFQRNK